MDFHHNELVMQSFIILFDAEEAAHEIISDFKQQG